MRFDQIGDLSHVLFDLRRRDAAAPVTRRDLLAARGARGRLSFCPPRGGEPYDACFTGERTKWRQQALLRKASVRLIYPR